jgi:hypothetical protein
MRLLTASAWLLLAVLVSGSTVRAGQGIAGLQANWKDLETWSRLAEGTRENELGLGLHPQGGAVVAFLGRLSIANPRQSPTQIRLHVAPAYMANSTVIRTRVLTFVADATGERPLKLDLSAGLRTDDPTPGGIVQNGIADMRAADFVRLAEATTLTGNILGFDVVFRPDQIRAMKAFAERLYLPTSKPVK